MAEASTSVNFNDIAWAAVCFYYRSVADRKYCRILGDTHFIEKLRQTPHEIKASEFEQKVLLDYVNLINYDMLIEHKLSERLLEIIVALQPDVSALQGLTLLDCDLSDSVVADRVERIYAALYSIPDLWATGISKIAHLLNDKLLVLLNMDLSAHFRLRDSSTGVITWAEFVQEIARQGPGILKSEDIKAHPRTSFQRSLVTRGAAVASRWLSTLMNIIGFTLLKACRSHLRGFQRSIPEEE